ncbi:WD domain, G-beta repeat [Rhizoctonia solani]|uniref:WD domain, G-beta repeat n=1 Tax=Rhizoctonia solani TaxID=456999 RepID=A0A8H7I570_9AGAM|nr:WD domain, G-beta repeat [Rhizoctonia solani]
MAQKSTVPFMMSLRESLSHTKDKWKRRLHLDSRDNALPISSPTTHPDRAQQHCPTETVSFRSAQSHSDTPFDSSLETLVDNIPRKAPSIWTSVRTLLATLEVSADAISPLKLAISGLRGCIDVYEGVCTQQREYHELGTKLVTILKDLAEHIEQPIGPVMTNSVRRIYSDLIDEARKVAEKQTRATGRLLIDALDGSDEILECYRRIDGHLERLAVGIISIIVCVLTKLLQRNANLSTLSAVNRQIMEQRLLNMSPSRSAIYNSAESQDLKRGDCAPGTRELQIKLLVDWARTSEAGRTCWMNGMAGTGKTTISYTVCSRLDDACVLGASFFCSRVIPECRQVKCIIPSIAYQLARFSIPFQRALDRVLETDPDAHTRALAIQYKKLIVGPLLEVQKSLPADFVVVIDALDECDNEDSIGQILELILSPEDILPIRFLVSSRPEREIVQRMSSRTDELNEARLVLHDLDSDYVKTDIESYMRYELKDVPLDNAQWSSIIESCGVLFIYASTTCRYIAEAYSMDTLDEAVGNIVGSSSNLILGAATNAIDQLYHTILSKAFNNPRMTLENKDKMRHLVETVILKQVEALLKPLRSVVNVAKDTGLVTTLHASFPDFMLSFERSESFYCKWNVRHTMMTKACLRLIDTVDPKFNICGLPSSYLLDTEVEDLDKKVAKSISPGLVYACRHWSAHLSLAEYQENLVELVHDFFSSRLLLWMEIINLTENMRNGTAIIRDAEKWCREQKTPQEVKQLAYDASLFVFVYATHPVSQSTPHIYTSMLPFWPKSRPVSVAYIPRTSGLVQPTGTAIDRRRRALIATWKVSTGIIQSISLSRDGRRLAIPTGDNIEVYDTTTGESLLKFNEKRTENLSCVAMSPDGSKVAFSSHEGIPYLLDTSNGGAVTELFPDTTSSCCSLAFSPDGSRIACGMENGDVHIYVLGRETSSHGPLKGHIDRVTSVAFSPDSLRVASGSVDKTARVWDVQTGQPVGTPFEGHISGIYSVTYCPTGSRVASGSSDKTIRVWDPETGKTTMEPLRGYSHSIYCVAFSPNSAFIASASLDCTIRVHDAHSGQTVLDPLQGHNGFIHSLIFSPDGTRLFSCSYDGTVRIWDVQDLNALDASSSIPVLSSAILFVAYSHDGSKIVSGSDNGAVHVWDVRAGKLVLGPLYGHNDAVAFVEYSPDDQYIASACYDGTLRIWSGHTGKDMHGPIQGHSDWANCVRFSPDGLTLVSGSYDGTVRIWEVKTGQQVIQLMNNIRTLSVGFSPDGHRVVCGSDNGEIHVLDRYQGTTLFGPIHAHEYGTRSVEFSPDGRRLVSGSSDNSVRVWNAETGKQLVICGEHGGAHSSWVLCVRFSLDGLYIVSASRDHSVRVWDSRNGNLLLGPLMGHTHRVGCVQFSPSDSRLVSCSHDRTIRFWDLSGLNKRSENDILDEAGAIISSFNDGSTRNHWSLDDDGWVMDTHGQRLLWVPPDLRTYLVLPHLLCHRRSRVLPAEH